MTHPLTLSPFRRFLAIHGFTSQTGLYYTMTSIATRVTRSSLNPSSGPPTRAKKRGDQGDFQVSAQPHKSVITKALTLGRKAISQRKILIPCPLDQPASRPETVLKGIVSNFRSNGKSLIPNSRSIPKGVIASQGVPSKLDLVVDLPKEGKGGEGIPQ